MGLRLLWLMLGLLLWNPFPATATNYVTPKVVTKYDTPIKIPELPCACEARLKVTVKGSKAQYLPSSRPFLYENIKVYMTTTHGTFSISAPTSGAAGTPDRGIARTIYMAPTRAGDVTITATDDYLISKGEEPSKLSVRIIGWPNPPTSPSHPGPPVDPLTNIFAEVTIFMEHALRYLNRAAVCIDGDTLREALAVVRVNAVKFKYDANLKCTNPEHIDHYGQPLAGEFDLETKIIWLGLRAFLDSSGNISVKKALKTLLHEIRHAQVYFAMLPILIDGEDDADAFADGNLPDNCR